MLQIPIKYKEHWRKLLNIKFWNPKEKTERNTSFEPKIEKSPTSLKFEKIDPTTSLTSNFETHKNVDDNFYFVYE